MVARTLNKAKVRAKLPGTESICNKGKVGDFSGNVGFVFLQICTSMVRLNKIRDNVRPIGKSTSFASSPTPFLRRGERDPRKASLRTNVTCLRRCAI